MLKIKQDPDLKIREELLSIHALNAFCPHDSSVRSYMFGSHLSQSLVLNNPDEPIIISGPEAQLIQNTFRIEVKHEAIVKAIIKRYFDIGYDDLEMTLLVQYIDPDAPDVDGAIDSIVVDNHFSLDMQSGFQRLINRDYLNSLRVGDIIPKGTILADSISTKDKSVWSYGLNANVCLLNIPETAEDGVIISESFARRLTYNKYEERIITFDKNSFLLTACGDKVFPDIGDYINEQGFIASIRNYQENIDMALLSVNDLKAINPIHDKTFYTYGCTNQDPTKTERGKVIDIKIFTPNQKDINTVSCKQIDKYNNSLRKYYSTIIEAYKKIRYEYFGRFRKELKLTGEFYTLLREAYGIMGFLREKQFYNFKLSNKNVEIKGTEIRFTILYENTRILIGNKLSDKHGAKGVIVNILPDDQMPYTYQNGHKVVADVIMDPSSIISRMNIGRSYENYFCLMSRHVKQNLQNAIPAGVEKLTDDEIRQHFSYLVEFYRLIGTEQYDTYAQIQDIQAMKEILHECLTKEVYIYYKISSPRKPPEIVTKYIKGTPYEPRIDKVHIPTLDGKEVITKNDIIIAPLYVILLNKTAENYLAIAGAKFNHFGFTIRLNKNIKHLSPIRYTPTRIISETEGRLYLGYGGVYTIAELIDRATSIDTHDEMYHNILEAPHPTNIESIVDRSKVPYGNNAALILVSNLFNAMGIGIDYAE